MTEHRSFKASVFDIEGNGLYETVTTAHCMVLKDCTTQTITRFTPESMPIANEVLNSYDLVIAHNGLDYDIPTLNKLYPAHPIIVPCLDTIVISRLLFPDRKGGHSLEAWGKRLGILKGVLMDDEAEHPEAVWETFSEEMLSYCEQDVQITYALMTHLLGEMNETLEEYYQYAYDIQPRRMRELLRPV